MYTNFNSFQLNFNSTHIASTISWKRCDGDGDSDGDGEEGMGNP